MLVFLTIDTEDKYYPEGRLLSGVGLSNELGVKRIMSSMERYGFRGNFFVNVYEEKDLQPQIMENLLGSIAVRGHSVELHTHPSMTHDLFRQSLTEYDVETQEAIIGAGVRRIAEVTGCIPIAHRGGGFCVNEQTLLALQRVGLKVDASHNAWASQSQLGKVGLFNRPVRHGEIIELPLSHVIRTEADGRVVRTLYDLESFTLDELIRLVQQAERENLPTLTLIMHSFSFLRRNKKLWKEPRDGRALFSSGIYFGYYNEIHGEDLEMVERFEGLLAFLRGRPSVDVMTIRDWVAQSPPCLPGCDAPLHISRRPIKGKLRDKGTEAVRKCGAAFSWVSERAVDSYHSRLAKLVELDFRKKGEEEQSFSNRAKRILAERAREYSEQDHIYVDYYRIGLRLRCPLPEGPGRLPTEVRVLPYDKPYPWVLFLMWSWEERLLSLGFATELNLGSAKVADAASRDVDALIAWVYQRKHIGKLDIGSATVIRLLSLALGWSWLSDEQRDKVHGTLIELLERGARNLGEYAKISSARGILGADRAADWIHNSRLVALFAFGQAARLVHHASCRAWRVRCRAVCDAYLQLSHEGWTESLSYDGLVLNALVDWAGGEGLNLPGGALSSDSKIRRKGIEGALERLLRAASATGLPDTPTTPALFGDIEPEHMNFYYSAIAKWTPPSLSGAWSWLLSKTSLNWLRADALRALIVRSNSLSLTPVAPLGITDCHYAVSMRQGWSSENLVTCVSCSNSTSSHVHFDAGSIIFGVGSQWLVGDAGPQQWIPGFERDFTIGTRAHNAPVINGLLQTSKAPRRRYLTRERPGEHLVSVNMSECYGNRDDVHRVERRVWSLRDRVVIADLFEGKKLQHFEYSWLLCAGASFWCKDGNVESEFEHGVRLTISCPGSNLKFDALQRAEGPRRETPLVHRVRATNETVAIVWWVFSIGDATTLVPELHEGALSIGTQRFEARETLISESASRRRVTALSSA